MFSSFQLYSEIFNSSYTYIQLSLVNVSFKSPVGRHSVTMYLRGPAMILWPSKTLSSMSLCKPFFRWSSSIVEKINLIVSKVIIIWGVMILDCYILACLENFSHKIFIYDCIHLGNSILILFLAIFMLNDISLNMCSLCYHLCNLRRSNFTTPFAEIEAILLQ